MRASAACRLWIRLAEFGDGSGSQERLDGAMTSDRRNRDMGSEAADQGQVGYWENFLPTGRNPTDRLVESSRIGSAGASGFRNPPPARLLSLI